VSPDEPVCNDLSGMVLHLAGEAGQVSLALTASSAGARASVDQHAAEIRDALARRGREVTPAALLSYAQGFAEAAIARGWRPPHRRDNPHDAAAGWTGHRNVLDWESLRLAAVCRMLIESQGRGRSQRRGR
jgi:hypothetical protein